MGSPNMDAIIEAAPRNPLIQNTLLKMDLKLTHYRNPVCSVSGGSDSDIMMDIIERVRGDRPVIYVFFDTGIEMQATKRHLDYLDDRYNIKIDRRPATVPVPKGCREYGLPFISKEVSEKIAALQAHGFRWEDEPYEVLSARYPNTEDGIKWWCNKKTPGFGIERYKYLKDFLVENPPPIRISDKCCYGSKKYPAALYYKEMDAQMEILGLRKAEGGVRAVAFSSCFSALGTHGIPSYRPLWYWSNDDKQQYKDWYGVRHSDCYEVWGKTRTGCAGCPFNSKFDIELTELEQYEPQLAIAAQNIFGASYEYTRAYRAYRDRCKAEDKLAAEQARKKQALEKERIKQEAKRAKKEALTAEKYAVRPISGQIGFDDSVGTIRA